MHAARITSAGVRRARDQTVFWAGNFQLVAAVVALVLVFRGHRWAPAAAAMVGLASAVGFTAAHVLPHWSTFSDSFTGSEVAPESPRSAWVAALFEIGADLAFGLGRPADAVVPAGSCYEPRGAVVGVIAWEASGAGPPIVFVHGITEDRHTWHSVVPFLEDGFRCVRLDLRGHGVSSDADDYGAVAMVVMSRP